MALSINNNTIINHSGDKLSTETTYPLEAFVFAFVDTGCGSVDI